MKNKFTFTVVACWFLFSQCGVLTYHTRQFKQADHLTQVKDQGLLVRLWSGDEKIEAYKRYQSPVKAKVIEDQIKGFNDQMVQGMKSNYDFSKVYYYYSRDADAIFKDHDYGKIMDENLEEGNIEIDGRPGVLLTLDRRLELNQWLDGEMKELDKLVYRFPTQRDKGMAHFVDNVFNITVVKSIKEMNNHFHRLYKG